MNYTVTATLRERPGTEIPFTISGIVNERPDVPIRSAIGTSNRAFAQLYVDAINAQQIYKNFEIRTDVDGKEYFSCTMDRPPALEAQMGKTVERSITREEADVIIEMANEARGSTDRQSEWRRLAFSLCHNPMDWKAPINVIVPSHAAAQYADAITYATSTLPTETLSEDGKWVRLRSIGYRMGPAGP